MEENGEIYNQKKYTPNKPSENFNTVLYTGNGTSQSITGVGFNLIGFG